MTAAQLLGLITAAVFVVVLVVVVVRAIRRPSRESIDIALFFGAPAIAIIQGWVARAIGVPGATVSVVSGALILAIPLLTLRAIRGFTELPRFVLLAATVAWAASAIVVLAAPTPMPPPLIVLILASFIFFEGYAGFAVLRSTGRAHGVTRRRLQLIGAGTLLLAITILNALLALAVPFASNLTLLLALFSAVTYLLGFSPPGPLRRAWQAPQVFEFVRRANRLVGEAASDLVNIGLARATAVATVGALSGV